MSVQVEKLEHNMAKLTITVPAETFNKAITQAYRDEEQISFQVLEKVKCLRQWQRKMYGAGMFYEDAANIVIPEEYDRHLQSKGYQDHISASHRCYTDGKRQRFHLYSRSCTKPEVTLGQYKGIEVPEK